jgi:hypothetical protein
MLNGLMLATAGIPVTSYTNAGGSGDRTSLVTVTCSANVTSMIGGGTLSNLVDGGFVADNNDSVDFASASFADGDFWTFDFGAGKRAYIDEIKTWFDRVVSWGTWKARASQDNTNWSEFNSFTWTGINGATVQAITGMPAHGFRYFGLLKVGATSGTVPRFKEAEFKIAGA